MLERLRDLPARPLDRPEYHAQYWSAYEHGGVFWKLERAQHFEEPGDASWEAFAAGDWEKSLELNEADRSDARAMAAKDREVGMETRRIRVVEHPVAPYLQWEMQFLRLLAEAGQSLRVVPAAAVAHLEDRAPLPEVVVLGGRVLFLVRYDSAGRACGAWRVDERDAIAAAVDELAGLFSSGEPLLDYFQRDIAPLPAPAVRP
ncbi:DUF6879 family protein [Streptomonospora wellingtoniae]|uniref:DUF6879 domain-containing protein n=1 Tax=Streptomonospora wellingtoniae TaxID=3075544 RepID=A0ABU2KYW4_9ACTN|nr:DUF6879 family protein [Streptomonospora sp. DSM 45055]MDT0304258.1 hypothetical protein [Streptomonospora sp. DSM 45055]